MAETLESLEPDPEWDSAGHEEAIATLRTHRNDITLRVWGGDWCQDSWAVLPEFGSALHAAEVPDAAIHQYPVEKDDDGGKIGPKVDTYGITLIPTIVLEYDGSEIVRFEESGDEPPIELLADTLEQLHAQARSS